MDELPTPPAAAELRRGQALRRGRRWARARVEIRMKDKTGLSLNPTHTNAPYSRLVPYLTSFEVMALPARTGQSAFLTNSSVT